MHVMLRHKQTDSLTKKINKTHSKELRKAMAVRVETYQHSKLQNLQSHLFRFSLQMWRDAKMKRKTRRQENDHMNP